MQKIEIDLKESLLKNILNINNAYLDQASLNAE